MGLKKEIVHGIKDILKKDKRNLFYIIYYSALEGILILSIPLASSFIIDSIVSHTPISVLVLGSIVLGMFVFITILRIIREYIIEKFQQKVFVEKSFEVAEGVYLKNIKANEPVDKVMNYFFDVTTIQKFFPVFVLDGITLIVNVIISLLLLLAFNVALFELGVLSLIFYVGLLLLFGYNGIKYAFYRSDTKHETIYFLQKVPYSKEEKTSLLQKLDNILLRYLDSRTKLFKVMIRQKTLSFAMQGIIMSGFLVLGGFLVINGKLPIGEFVAADIVVVSIISSINRFIKQIDYVYEVVEGLYKVGKLTKVISGKENG